jgi:hypothetical protein
MGGRYMHYNADQLTEMLLDDILADTAFEMQDIENKLRNREVENQSKDLASNLMQHIVDYQNEESLVQMQVGNENIVNAKATNKIDVSETKYELNNQPSQPKALQFNESNDF